MFSSKESEDTAFFKPVRNPRRPRDAPAEDDGDAKTGGESGQQSKEDGVCDEKGVDPKDAMAESSKPGRRRRAGDEAGSDAKGSGGDGGNSWMTSPEKQYTQKLMIEQDEIADETAPKGGKKDKFFSEADQDDIIMIPDLDEDGADADHRVAHAPRNVHRKIPSLADLESEVKQAVAFADEGYDLSILLRTLVPPTLVQEADETWTFESLLREVTDELTLTPKTVVGATIASSASKEAKEKEKLLKLKPKVSVKSK